MKRYIYLIISFVSVVSQAQTVKKYANEYLNIGVDAAALAMGNSMVAHTSNAYSTYWNPAGLTKIESPEIGLMHASYFGNIAQYDFATYAQRVNENIGVGVGLTRFGVDNILNTTELINQKGEVDYSRITKFSTADYAMNFALGYQTKNQKVQIGINAKVLYRQIGNFADAWGYGLDVGMQYQLENEWALGAVVRDFSFTETIWNFNEKEIDKIRNTPGNEDAIPEKAERSSPKLQLGVSKNYAFSEDLSLLTSFQINTDFFESNSVISSNGISLEPALGMQLNYQNIVFVRAGVNNFQYEQDFEGERSLLFQPNAGVGFHYKGISVDYALTNIANQGGGIYSNIFSLRLDLSVFKR